MSSTMAAIVDDMGLLRIDDPFGVLYYDSHWELQVRVTNLATVNPQSVIIVFVGTDNLIQTKSA
jgi:hypothetical protein